MSTAWTIRSRRNAASFNRPASLISLPDLSDDLEISSRPSSGAGGLFESWGHIPSDSKYKSNISVSYLGSRILRQYRSVFRLSDEHVISVNRSEIFHPEEAKADVRVNLSLQGPPNETITCRHRRSQSTPNLILNRLDENNEWARLMLTIDRPRDSELLGRIGGQNYFSRSEVNAPYFHRRITPMRKAEEYIIGASTVHGNSEPDEKTDNGTTTLMSGTILVREPSIDRVEKETCLDTARRQASPIIGPSPVAIPSRPSLDEKG